MDLTEAPVHIERRRVCRRPELEHEAPTGGERGVTGIELKGCPGPELGKIPGAIWAIASDEARRVLAIIELGRGVLETGAELEHRSLADRPPDRRGQIELMLSSPQII